MLVPECGCVCVAESTRSAISLGSLPGSLRSTESDPSTWTLPTLPWRDWELNLDDLRVRRIALSSLFTCLGHADNLGPCATCARLCPLVPTCACPPACSHLCRSVQPCMGGQWCSRVVQLGVLDVSVVSCCESEPDFCFGVTWCPS